MLKNFIGFVTTLIFGLALGSVAIAQEPNFGGLWWNPQEPGWGIAVDHQGHDAGGFGATWRPSVVFAALATYDVDGSPVWFVMPRAEHGDPFSDAGNGFEGPIYRLTGPAFSAVPFDSSMVTATWLGRGSFYFPSNWGLICR